MIQILTPLLDEDCIRIIRYLLSSTQLFIQLGKQKSRVFETNKGTLQGDALSPVLFIVYLEATLRNVSNNIPRHITEVIFADDIDFTATDRQLEGTMDKLANTFEKSFLKINTEKTEYTIVRRCDERHEEKWRHTKKLGTFLGDTEDMIRRKSFATFAL
ncbi:uncharacterized protein LOC115229385 [Octopus sinensis]|uniref:Uncharacterized protein LOC115229385 n=1 Tax=Octopus sinensis TaxID=2607531 RepID=A0A6P7U273_9MOLL|nr:uncharacterized protein LOC115229385 [Octopus sinensis]